MTDMQDKQAQPELDPFLEEYSYDSMFGPAEVFTVETEDGQPLRCLYVDGGFQTATYLGDDRFKLPFAYCEAFDVMFQRAPSPTDILLIGGGAFSYPKHVLTSRLDCSMDVVEIDPAIIDIARKHFFVDQLEQLCGNRLRSFAEDGMDFLRNAEEGRYEAIINDSFAGTALDAPLLSQEGLKLTKRAMKDGGIYLLNAVVEDDEDADEDERAQALQELQNIHDALASAFTNVACNDVEDEEYYGCINHIFIASDGPIPA